MPSASCSWTIACPAWTAWRLAGPSSLPWNARRASCSRRLTAAKSSARRRARSYRRLPGQAGQPVRPARFHHASARCWTGRRAPGSGKPGKSRQPRASSRRQGALGGGQRHQPASGTRALGAGRFEGDGRQQRGDKPWTACRPSTTSCSWTCRCPSWTATPRPGTTGEAGIRQDSNRSHDGQCSRRGPGSRARGRDERPCGQADRTGGPLRHPGAPDPSGASARGGGAERCCACDLGAAGGAPRHRHGRRPAAEWAAIGPSTADCSRASWRPSTTSAPNRGPASGAAKRTKPFTSFTPSKALLQISA